MIQTSTVQITPEILALVAEIDEFKGAWRALGTLAPERLSALRRVATIESIGSSTRIEGRRLSDREVEQLLSNLEIHPFQDGNGRLSRVLTMLLLLRAVRSVIPIPGAWPPPPARAEGAGPRPAWSRSAPSTRRATW